MSADKTERLLNLVICLLSTRRTLTREQIRQAISAYAAQPDDSLFERMFERDKDELRDLGVPLEVVAADPLFGDDLGYRVNQAEYALAPVEFAPEERAALVLAARIWNQASLAGPAARALLKLSSLGVSQDAVSVLPIEPSLGPPEPSFAALWAAVRDQVPVAFDYHTPPRPQPEPRQVEPWSVTSWRGRWYLAGYDRDREAARVFRLSRIHGKVRRLPGKCLAPRPTQVRSLFTDLAQTRQAKYPEQTAQLWLRPERAVALRQKARPAAGAEPGWEAVCVDFRDPDQLAEEICALGAFVRAISPPELVDLVRLKLTAVQVAHG